MATFLLERPLSNDIPVNSDAAKSGTLFCAYLYGWKRLVCAPRGAQLEMEIA